MEVFLDQVQIAAACSRLLEEKLHLESCGPWHSSGASYMITPEKIIVMAIEPAIGWAMIHLWWDQSLNLMVYVRPQHRGQNIGSKLCVAACEECKTMWPERTTWYAKHSAYFFDKVFANHPQLAKRQEVYGLIRGK